VSQTTADHIPGSLSRFPRSLVLLVLAESLVKTAIAFFTYGSTDILIRESVGALRSDIGPV